jgi:hypothetical protein
VLCGIEKYPSKKYRVGEKPDEFLSSYLVTGKKKLERVVSQN